MAAAASLSTQGTMRRKALIAPSEAAAAAAATAADADEPAAGTLEDSARQTAGECWELVRP